MAGKTLRDLVREREDLDAFVLMQEGELDENLEVLLTDNTKAITEKIERIGWHVTNEQEKCETIDRQIARLKARKQAIERRIDWLKNSYLADMLATLGRSVKGALATVRMQLNNPRLDGVPENPRIDIGESDQAKLQAWYTEGAEFVKEHRVYTLDRKALLTALQDETGLGVVQRERWNERGAAVVRDESVRIA